MLKIFVLLLFFIVIVHGKESSEQIEVVAKTISSTQSTVYGNDGVVVYYGDSIIKANSAVYNRESNLLVLDGKVEMIGYNGSKSHMSHLELNIDSDEVTFKELFLVTQNDVWIYADDAHRVDGNYTFGKSMFSSCDANDPLWKMTFEKSKYDSIDEYMKVYDAKVYFMDMPIAYTPYMAFSTNNKRSSGLLFPLFGYNSNEGFIYEQPIFWAISDNMDLELNPQIRTNRSIGMYGTYRFVDSAHSKGELRVGYFKDKASYAEEHSLNENHHYGLEFNYESSKLFSDKFFKGFTDGLYINSTFLNDIDYINLQKTSLNHFGVTPLQESRLNYFMYDNDYYAGVNAKYFIDTRKLENEDTVQQLPTLQLHRYLSSFLIDNFTYSADLRIRNLYREVGVTMQQATLNVPLEFTTSFFDDYVSVTLAEDLFYSKSYFGNSIYEHDSFQYGSNLHRAKIFSDLTKKYDSFTHMIQPSMSYMRPGYESERPVSFEYLTEDQQELFTVGLPEENYVFSLGQYFYDDSMKLKFYQRFYQKYYRNREYKFADMGNEMEYSWDRWKLYNNVVYSNEFNKVRESSSRIRFNKSEYYFGIGHTYKQNLPDKTTIVPANDINFNFGYTYNQNVGFIGSFTYDLDNDLSEQWNFGANYKQDCWSMSASMRRSITPRPTGQTVDDTFYVQFNFIPFLTVGSD